jgi:hypothetical protein
VVDITVTSDVDEFVDELNVTMSPALAKGLLKAANFAGGAIAERVNAIFSGGTGNLARSFLPARFVSVGGKIGAGAFSDLPYAEIQNRGGTITPATKDYLAIPLSSEAKNRWPRDWPVGDLFAFRSKRGNLLLAERRTGTDLRIHYLLRKSVDIPATNYLEQAMQEAEPTIVEIVDEAVQAAIDEAES